MSAAHAAMYVVLKKARCRVRAATVRLFSADLRLASSIRNLNLVASNLLCGIGFIIRSRYVFSSALRRAHKPLLPTINLNGDDLLVNKDFYNSLVVF